MHHLRRVKAGGFAAGIGHTTLFDSNAGIGVRHPYPVMNVLALGSAGPFKHARKYHLLGGGAGNTLRPRARAAPTNLRWNS